MGIGEYNNYYEKKLIMPNRLMSITELAEGNNYNNLTWSACYRDALNHLSYWGTCSMIKKINEQGGGCT